MIARYLIQRMGYGVSDALECVTIARGHPIERENYISNLGRNVEQLPKILDGKDICRGRAEGDPMRKGSKRPADKGKEHVNRHGPARDSFRGRDARNAPSSVVSPWEPGHGPHSTSVESREEGVHRPRRSEFVDESQFQAAPVGYWGGGVHHPQPYPAGPRPNDPPPSQFVPEGRRDYRDEGRGMGLTGFDPRVPPPISVFPQHRDMRPGDHNGRRPAHSEFVREEHHPWPPAAPHRGHENHGPTRDYMPHHSGRHSPPPGWQGPPHQRRYSPTRHRMSPTRGRMSPPRGRISPQYGDRYPPRRTSPHSRMSPHHHGRRMSSPRGSPPRGHRISPHGRRMSSPRGSPPRGRRMSPPQGSRGLTPPPPPRSFRTPPPPTRRSPSRGPRMSPPRRHGSSSRPGSPPRALRPPSPRGGPVTPPYRSSHPVEQSPPRGHRIAPSERRPSPSRRRAPPPMSRSPPPVSDGMPLPKYQRRRSPPRGLSPGRGRPDHLDMKYGPEIEPFPLERSPPRPTPLDDRNAEPSVPRSSNSSRTRRSRSPFRHLDFGRKPISPPRKTSLPPPMRRSPPLKRPLSPRQPYHDVSVGREKGRRSPLPSNADKFEKREGRVEVRERSRCQASPPNFDRNAPRQGREWKEARGMKKNQYDHLSDNDRPVDFIDLRSGSSSPTKIIDDRPQKEKRSHELPRTSEPAVDSKRSRPRTPEIQEVPRRRELRTSEPAQPRRRQRTPEPHLEPRRGVLRAPERQIEPRRGPRSPEPQRESRKRSISPEPRGEPVRRRNSTPEPRGEPIKHGIRTPEPRQVSRRRGLRTPEPQEEPGRRGFKVSPEPQEEYRRLRTPEPQVDARRRVPRTPDPAEVPRRRLRSPEPLDEQARRGIRSPDPRDEPIRRRIRSPEPEEVPRRRLRSPEPREDSIERDTYQSPELEEEPVEPYDDPRSYGVLRTPEPLEEEPRRGGPSERFDRGNYRDDNPRYNRGGHFQGNRRPHNNYRGRMRGRGRISRGGPVRQNTYYDDRTIRKPYLDQPQYLQDPLPEEYHGYAPRRSRSRSPIVIPREVPVMDEVFADEEPDCRELLIEKRTTVAAGIGALSPTALELIGPDDEILFIGSSSEQGNSRSSSIRRRPAVSRLSPRLPRRLSRSPPPKKPVFERLDDSKPPVFERLDDPMPEPRSLMEERPRGPFEFRGTGRIQRGRSQSGHRPSRGFPTRPSSSYRDSNTDRSSMRGIRSQPQGGSRSSSRGISSSHDKMSPSRGKISSSHSKMSSSRGIPTSRGTSSSRGISTSRGRISSSRGKITSSRGGISSTRGATSSRVLSSSSRARPSLGSLARPKKPAEPSGNLRAASKKIQSSSQSTSESLRRPTKTAQPSARTGQSVRGKTAGKVSTKALPKASVKSVPAKKTRGAPRGKR